MFLFLLVFFLVCSSCTETNLKFHEGEGACLDIVEGLDVGVEQADDGQLEITDRLLPASRGGEGGEHKEATVLRGREQKPRKTIATVHTITHMVVGSDSKKTAG